MKIFINDIPVRIISSEELDEGHEFDLVIDGATTKIKPKSLIDDVLIRDASPDKVDELLHVMTDNKLKKVDSITFTSSDKSAIIKYIKSKFKVIEAAGGVVDKDGKILLILRKGKWDIPKGKLDKSEKKRACAVREVEEETGVKVTIEKKINATWHTYVTKKKYVLKKTHWYAMNCIDDSALAPQEEEDIEEVRWMNLSELRAALYNSYRSIRVVIQEYHKLLKIHDQSL
ncbi:NUDIX hydrolase [Marinoscillum furvescens]|uniref:ADP-ribose pyrophosphatase YjhB (NUDIX family) n=1 Tax=Marinoscillum furvescens DSM 4134 TaxID=1122208 RepID=A0A3D9L187_MARFU|nr:NUDIX hydrolase [Marinoscillum furvescens]RED97503.1 ADP-ribose pyrophosphatase YjhB (NUDIX family) [Marinoscillum furvescens DSM 4134]